MVSGVDHVLRKPYQNLRCFGETRVLRPDSGTRRTLFKLTKNESDPRSKLIVLDQINQKQGEAGRRNDRHLNKTWSRTFSQVHEFPGSSVAFADCCKEARSLSLISPVTTHSLKPGLLDTLLQESPLSSLNRRLTRAFTNHYEQTILLVFSETVLFRVDEQTEPTEENLTCTNRAPLPGQLHPSPQILTLWCFAFAKRP